MKELIEIQSKLKAPKDLVNSFAHFNYRSAEGILEAVKPLLKENNCTLTISDDIIIVGNRIYVKAVATLKNAKGETETTTAFAREEETKKGYDASQITGSASSYARKYALNGLFCIDDNKDADATNDFGKSSQAQKSTQPAVSSSRLDEAFAIIRGTNTKAGLTKVYNDFPDLQSVTNFINALTARKKELK